jgi:hypothetical protein
LGFKSWCGSSLKYGNAVEFACAPWVWQLSQGQIVAVGTDLEKFAVENAKADDIAVANVYTKAGAKVYDLDDATLAKWQALARPIWKDYSSKNENCAKLLAAAEKLL